MRINRPGRHQLEPSNRVWRCFPIFEHRKAQRCHSIVAMAALTNVRIFPPAFRLCNIQQNPVVWVHVFGVRWRFKHPPMSVCVYTGTSTCDHSTLRVQTVRTYLLGRPWGQAGRHCIFALVYAHRAPPAADHSDSVAPYCLQWEWIDAASDSQPPRF